MKRCDDCRYRNEPEYNKPCVVYRDDCELYERKGVKRMSINEAIEELNAIKSEYSNKNLEDKKLMRSEKDALDMAIKALEQEPREDATLKDIFCMGCEYKEQEPKTGHWIKGNIHEGIYCSECETNAPTDYDFHYMRSNYCPNCGAKMIEPQESEEISDTNMKMWEELFKAESEVRNE